jgi:two-component system, LytTR family, response regulator
VVAIDDEPPALLAFRQAMSQFPDFVVAATSDDPLAAETLIRAERPAVVFLDIQMPGRTGFDIVQALGADRPLVVFVTAYDAFAVRAFDANAVDYLLKPIVPARLRETLDRLRRQLTAVRAGDAAARLDAVVEQLRQQAAQPALAVDPMASRVSVRAQGRTTFLDPRLIDRVDASDNEIVIAIGAQRLRIREPLGEFEARLPQSLFLRVHRSTLVNRARITHTEPYFHGDVVIHLANGTHVVSGRSYRVQVRRALGLDG